MKKVPRPQVVTTAGASQLPLPAEIEAALGELVGAEREGRVAWSGGVGVVCWGAGGALVRLGGEGGGGGGASGGGYGRGAAGWTGDPVRGKALAGQIEAGMIFVNGLVASDARIPFGGIKRSGYGRELSEFGIKEVMNIQTVWVGPAR